MNQAIGAPTIVASACRKRGHAPTPASDRRHERRASERSPSRRSGLSAWRSCCRSSLKTPAARGISSTAGNNQSPNSSSLQGGARGCLILGHRGQAGCWRPAKWTRPSLRVSVQKAGHGGSHERDRNRHFAERRGNRRRAGSAGVPAVGLRHAKVDKDFASCFARGRGSSAAPPGGSFRAITGGTISNLGSKNGAATYFIAINDRGGRREIALDQRAADAAPRKALNECI